MSTEALAAWPGRPDFLHPGLTEVQDWHMLAAERLIHSLRVQPVLIVLRPVEPLQALPALECLQDIGLIHAEIAWRSQPDWIEQMGELVHRCSDLQLGAASVCEPQGVAAAVAAGCRYAVSPVLDAELQQQAADLDLVLVPGVMTPSEVHRARRLGCRLVKLFPAVSVGRDHWRRLLQPLGDPTPFCIAAGGLSTGDVLPWLEAGVDAVALGWPLGDLEGATALRALLTALSERSAAGAAVKPSVFGRAQCKP